MDGNRKSSFWPSYVDIMTTLFAIMLVLFVVSFSRFKIKEKLLRSIVDEYENIVTVYTTIDDIDSTAYFGYDEEYLKHLFTVDVEYQQKEYRIDKLSLDLVDSRLAQSKRDSIIKAGQLIKEAILSIEKKQSSTSNKAKNNIKFLVVIEGQSSKVPYNVDDYHNNYTLSYLRAQYLNDFWKSHGIDIASIPKCELIISGSGEDGVPRVKPSIKKPKTDEQWDKWKEEESKNQRFLIHIVPVIGDIDMTQDKMNKLKGEY